MTLQNTNDTDSNSEKPALEARKASVEAEAFDPDLSATYSPDDNKLRLYAVRRLDPETYGRVKAAGFIWAPKQELFVAPMWTPEREDLLIALCGQIDDEDTGLTERAEERAERFTEYSGKRQNEAQAASEAVARITDGIPMGQPILVGHHSEKAARRDQKRIENGMRRAVTLWHTSEYWTRRAQGALRLARYKERSDVRARRIKRIEADKRKQERAISESSKLIKAWSKEGISRELATMIAGHHDHISVNVEGKPYGASLYSLLEDGSWTAERAAGVAIEHHERRIARASRWVAHYSLRLDYERAMLGEAGGLVADRFDIVPGGTVLIGREWLTVLRVNKKDGRIVSVRTNARFVPIRGAEEVQDYRAPEAGAVEAVKAANTLGPIVNFPGDEFLAMTAAEFKEMHKDYKQIRKAKATEATGAYRFRQVMKGFKLIRVYLTDAKRVDVPAAPAATPAPLVREPVAPTVAPKAYEPKPSNKFDAMAEQLKTGVQVVTAPQLFPTPATVAARMVDLSGIKTGDSLLEPSAGTGVLLDAVRAAGVASVQTIIELNWRLADRLRLAYDGVKQADFMEQTPEQLGTFDVCLMNPPFANGADIAHITHARKFLKPGGRLVAICADGPRQADKLRPLVEACGGIWEPLPEGTFKATGTNVRTVLLTLLA